MKEMRMLAGHTVLLFHAEPPLDLCSDALSFCHVGRLFRDEGIELRRFLLYPVVRV